MERLGSSRVTMQRRPLCYIAAFWALGSAVGYAVSIPWQIPALIAALFLALLLWRRRFVCLLGMLAFVSMLVTGLCAIRPAPIETRRGVEISGIVDTDPVSYEEYTILYLQDVTIDGEAYPYRVRLYQYPDSEGVRTPLQYGETLVGTVSSVKAPKSQTGIGGYDSAEALWRNGAAATANMSNNRIISVEEGSFSLQRKLLQLRHGLAKRIERLYPVHSSLAKALLIGDRSCLTDEEYAAFEGAGIVHLLAVSGLHISILAQALLLLMRYVFRLSRKAGYLIILPFLLFYAAVTGFPASILRAALCFALMEAAPLMGRPADRLTGIAAAYLILAVVSPLSAFGAGFQLSFCAVLGMALMAPTIETALKPRNYRRSKAIVVLWGIGRIVIAGLCASLGTLPVVAGLYGGLTLWSLAANIVAIPLANIAMPVMALSLILTPLAAVGEWLLGVILWFADLISALPAKLYVALPEMRVGFIGIYIAIILCGSMYYPGRGGSRKRTAMVRASVLALLVLVAGASILWAQWPYRTNRELEITFIDVGQGDSALINAQGNLYMVDTGRTSSSSARLRSQCLTLDALFLTHPDDDHSAQAASVIEAGRVNTVYLPETWARLEIEEDLADALAGCNVVYLAAGDEVRLSEDVTCKVLHPEYGYEPKDSNDAGLVLLIEYGAGSCLMMADLADADIDFFVPDCDVVKLAHHGSGYSSGTVMLQCTSPSAAIISVGVNNYGHPAQTVLDRLEQMQITNYRTDESGDIKCLIHDNGSIEIRSWIEE